MVCLHILTKKTQRLTCWTPLAANRTLNRIGIRMENRTCRRPLIPKNVIKRITLRQTVYRASYTTCKLRVHLYATLPFKEMLQYMGCQR
jgi:hypothetical protein